jgi:hypothetical protein
MKTPKEFAYALQEFGENLKLPKFKNSIEAMLWYEEQKQAERNEWEKMVEERDNQIRTLAGIK